MFGNAVYVNLKEYQPVAVPYSIKDFMSGSYIRGVWSKKWPGDSSQDSRNVEIYENTLMSVINSAFTFFKSYQPGTTPLKYALDISRDIDFFRDYITLKEISFDPMIGSAGAKDIFYNKYFGGYSGYSDLMSFLGNQSSLSTENSLIKAETAISNLNFDVAMTKQNFYKNKIIPIANKFSQSDQQFLQDVFLFQLEGETNLSDLVRGISLVAKYINAVDLVILLKFAPQMVLGNDFAQRVINPDFDSPRNISKEVNQITQNYNALKSRLGRYLDSSTDALFAQRVEILRMGYANPEIEKYSVCGEVCAKIQENILNAIEIALTEATGLKNQASENSSNGAIDSNSVTNKAINSIMTAITPGMNVNQTDKLDVTKSSSSDTVNSGRGIGGVGLLFLLAAGYYLLKEKK